MNLDLQKLVYLLPILSLPGPQSHNDEQFLCRGLVTGRTLCFCRLLHLSAGMSCGKVNLISPYLSKVGGGGGHTYQEVSAHVHVHVKMQSTSVQAFHTSYRSITFKLYILQAIVIFLEIKMKLQ